MSGTGDGAPWYLRLGAWVGMGTGPGALMAGGGIAAATVAGWRLPAVLLGVATLTTLAVLSGHNGWAQRSATVGLAARAFGSVWGERVVGLLIMLGVCGWSGFYVGVSSGALQQLWGWSPLLTGALFGSGMSLLFVTGFKRWNLMVAITGAASVAVAVLVSATVVTSDEAAPTTLMDGAQAIVFGIGIVVAYAAVFALRAPDFTWDARRGSDVVRAGAVMAVAMTTFLLLGVTIYNRAGSFDLSQLVTATQVPLAGVLLLIVSAIAPAVSGLHSGALTMRRLAGWKHWQGGILVAAIGATLGATRFDLRLLAFLGVLGAIMPPILGVVLVRRPHNADWHAWTGWALGSVASALLLIGDYPAHVLVGIATSSATVFVLGRTATSRTKGTSWVRN